MALANVLIRQRQQTLVYETELKIGLNHLQVWDLGATFCLHR